MRMVVTIATMVLATGMASAKDRTGFAAIDSGDLARAERIIQAEQRVHPGRPELMLNLASVYARTGRTADARALYAAVLDRPVAAMDLPSGEVASSHALATRGLAGLTDTRIAIR